MFKVNNKNTRAASFDVVVISSLLTFSILHTFCSIFYIDDFEPLNFILRIKPVGCNLRKYDVTIN